MRDAHKILSVARNASVQEIKLSYRRLAMQLHPDTNGGDVAKAEQFKKVNDAYSFLTDPKAQEEESYDDFETYSSRPHYAHASSSHWNPFQSPFQNMKNSQRGKNDFRAHHMDFEEWDDFDFVDFVTGEDVVFGFDKKGKARSSREKQGGKKKSQSKSRKKTATNSAFEEFTTEEIEDIIRNSSSTSPGWGSQDSHSPRQQGRKGNSSTTDTGWGSKGTKSRKKPTDKSQRSNSNNGGSRNKSGKSRRRRRGGDDCTIS